MRKVGWVCAVLVLGLFLGGCKPERKSRGARGIGSRHASGGPRGYQMGDPVKTGPLVYTVLDTEWLDQIGDPGATRLPRDHYLCVRISVTNTGSTTSGVPPLTILDSRRVPYAEVEDAKGLPEWLGYMRLVRPAETLHGRIVFDAPTADYHLRVVDDAEPEAQSSATIQMPLELVRP